jgi:broad specificity phosphatase PhoE
MGSPAKEIGMPRKIVLCLALFTLLVAPAVAAAQTLVFVARHAERADDPARNQEDPPLSQVGQQRAARLAAMLKDADVKAIYVTAFRRTQETAAPLAAALKLRPEIMPASVPALITALKSRHAKDVVFIVAHSTTVPNIVKALGGSQVELSDWDYDSLFVVAPAAGTAVRIRY